MQPDPLAVIEEALHYAIDVYGVGSRSRRIQAALPALASLKREREELEILRSEDAIADASDVWVAIAERHRLAGRVTLAARAADLADAFRFYALSRAALDSEQEEK